MVAVASGASVTVPSRTDVVEAAPASAAVVLPMSATVAGKDTARMADGVCRSGVKSPAVLLTMTKAPLSGVLSTCRLKVLPQMFCAEVIAQTLRVSA